MITPQKQTAKGSGQPQNEVKSVQKQELPTPKASKYLIEGGDIEGKFQRISTEKQSLINESAPSSLGRRS